VKFKCTYRERAIEDWLWDHTKSAELIIDQSKTVYDSGRELTCNSVYTGNWSLRALFVMVHDSE